MLPSGISSNRLRARKRIVCSHQSNKAPLLHLQVRIATCMNWVLCATIPLKYEDNLASFATPRARPRSCLGKPVRLCRHLETIAPGSSSLPRLAFGRRCSFRSYNRTMVWHLTRVPRRRPAGGVNSSPREEARAAGAEAGWRRAGDGGEVTEPQVGVVAISNFTGFSETGTGSGCSRSSSSLSFFFLRTVFL